MILECSDLKTVTELPSLVKSETVPFPKFQLFEVAVLQYQLDDEKEMRQEVVQVVGMTWCPAGYKDAEWVYHVRNLYQPTNSQLPPGHQEDCCESDLTKWVVAE